MIDSAAEVILVADHTKFGRITFGHICDLGRVDTIITDEGVPERIAEAIEQRGVKLHVVSARRSAQASSSRKRQA